jgi:transposase
VAGVIGRATGQVRLFVLDRTTAADLQASVGGATAEGAWVYTDEWGGYAWVTDSGRSHATVCHTPGVREWARDDDGDGIREVHNNTCEGLWAGLRTFLRPFRGTSKWFLDEYVCIFQWIANTKTIATEFLRALLKLDPQLTTNYSP